MNFFNKYVRSGRYWKLWRCDLCSACLHVYFLWADVWTPIDMISCWNIACTYWVLFRGFQNSFSKCYITFFSALLYSWAIWGNNQTCFLRLFLSLPWKMGKNYLFSKLLFQMVCYSSFWINVSEKVQTVYSPIHVHHLSKVCPKVLLFLIDG